MRTEIRQHAAMCGARPPWATAACLLLAALGCNGSPAASSETGNDSAAESAHVVVRVQAAQRRSIAQTVTALGRCEALPEKLALLTPVIEGQVQTMLVKQGQQVTANQPIIRLDPTLAQADLAERTAARDSLTASLSLLQSLPRPKEQEASKLAIEQAKIEVARSEALVERLRPLRARGEVSEQQMFEADQALKHARVLQQTAEAQYEVLMLGPRPEAVAEAQAKIQSAEAAVQLAQARLDLLTIRAPIDGVLDSLTCRPGQTLAVGTSIGEIVDNRQVLAMAWLPVRSGRLARVGQTAQVRIAAPGLASSAESEKRSEVTAQVVFAGRVADPQTGNMPVHVLVDNPQGELVIGQTLELTILVQQPAETLAVPAAAIHDEGEGSAVTVVRDGKAVVLQPQFGAADAGWVAVSGADLKAGESVIVAGAYNLPDGTPVKVQAAEPEDKQPQQREPK